MIFTENFNKLLHYMKIQAESEDEAKRSYFHTYTPATNKTHGFVICGLDNRPSIEEVQDALLHEHDIEIVTT